MKNAKAKKTKKAPPWERRLTAIEKGFAEVAILEGEINRIDEELVKDKREQDRLDTEVKRAHARISDLERAIEGLTEAVRRAAQMLAGLP